MGFTPRRNPDIIVCVLFEGGEHGKLAARLATQVIKATSISNGGSPPKWRRGPGKVEIGVACGPIPRGADGTTKSESHCVQGDS